MISTLNLTDVYRYQNQTKQIFTYIRLNSQTRIDRIYLNQKALNLYNQITHENAPFADHSQPPVLTINLPTHLKWGFGLYKLNNSILNDPHVITELTVAWDNWKIRKPEDSDLLTY